MSAGYGRPVTIHLPGHLTLAALTSADLVPPPAPAADGPPSLAWLRAHVARFSSGTEHRRRRVVTEARLAAVDPEPLRERASSRARSLRDAAATLDVMADVARVVPVLVLAEALGAESVRVADVALVARWYLTGPPAGVDTTPVDAAVGRLATACPGEDDEEAAMAIGLLVQSYEATAGLIGNGFLAAVREGEPESTVLGTTRVAAVDTELDGVHIGAGEPVRVDLSAPSQQFGAGAHACPGATQARAIAAGVVAALAGCRLADVPVAYRPGPNAHVPERLLVITR